MQELSEPAKKLIEKYKLWHDLQQPKQGISTIHVDEVALRVAAFYEHLRTVIEWKEEHLMRRAAIIRKLKRRFLDFELNNFTGVEDAGESLVLELIRGGHFPNDKIEETKIAEVQQIISKYVFLLKNNPDKGLQFYTWLIEVCSCEIEETLCPSTREMSLIDFMFELVKKRIKINDKKNRDVQVYIAVQQALFKLDKPMISYNLIKKNFFSLTGENIYGTWQKIEAELILPFGKKFYAICEKYDTPYLLLGDTLSEKNIEKTIQEIKEPPLLEEKIRTAYKKRLSGFKQKIWRAAIYSTVSIFVTKILSLAILEIFLAGILTGRLNFLTLAFDVFIPTVLMFALVASVKPPSKKNLNLVILESMKIVYAQNQTDVYEIKTQKKRGIAMRAVISLAYTLSAFISFGAIYGIFKIFGFPITSIIINIIFIALILFAGSAVRKRAQELAVEDEPEGFLSFFSDIFFLPVAGVGKWLSSKWKKYNAVAAFFNILIDMPFSVFVEFIEKWRYFIKEKKEELH